MTGDFVVNLVDEAIAESMMVRRLGRLVKAIWRMWAVGRREAAKRGGIGVRGVGSLGHLNPGEGGIGGRRCVPSWMSVQLADTLSARGV